MSVVELVGQIPDAHLKGMIVSNAEPTGIVVYESGRRIGHTVVVTTTIYPRLSAPSWAPNQLLTEFGCLGEMPRFDHMGSVVPTSTLKLTDNEGSDVTSQIEYMYLSRMDEQQPVADSTQYVRYPEDSYGPSRIFPLPLGPDGLTIPSNSGCRIQMTGVDYPQLLGVFTIDFVPTIRVSVLGSQEARFRSYIGEGAFGIFQPLMDQLRLRFGDRHRRIALSVPKGANYILVRFPPTPADPYADPVGSVPYLNAERPTGGTYRLALDTVELSADLSFSAAFPLKVAWQDSDQIPKRRFLAVMEAPNQLAPPEYILPTDIQFDDCYTRGNCSDQLLQQIYGAQMTLEIFYLSIVRVTKEGEWIRLKMAGPTWSATALGSSLDEIGSFDEPLAVGALPAIPLVDDDAVRSTNAGLSIAKAVSPHDDVPYHSNVTYTVSLSNLGPLDATGVVLTDHLPAPTSFVRWLEQPDGSEVDGDQIRWIGTVPAKGALILAFVASQTAGYGLTIRNTVEYSATESRGEAAAAFVVEPGRRWSMYLPLVMREVGEAPDGIPYGWFDGLGRMLDYTP